MRNIRTTFFWERYKKCWGFLFPEFLKVFPVQIFFLFFELGMKSVGFHFQKYKKRFLQKKYTFFQRRFFEERSKKKFTKKFWGLKPESVGLHFEKYENLSNIRARKFHFPKYKEFFSKWIFLNFFGRPGFRKCVGRTIYKNHTKNKLSLLTEVDEPNFSSLGKPKRWNNFKVKFQNLKHRNYYHQNQS